MRGHGRGDPMQRVPPLRKAGGTGGFALRRGLQPACRAGDHAGARRLDPAAVAAGGSTDALLTLPAGGPTDRTLLKSPRISVDRSGGFVPELVELSDVLPPQVFDVRNFL